LTDKNLFKRKIEAPQTIAKADFICATITEVTASGLRILVDGETAATSKVYKQLLTDHYLAAGDRVIVMQQNGTYVVLGTIGIQSEPVYDVYYTTDVSEICATNSNFTIDSAAYAQWGKMATLNIHGVCQKASSSSSDDTTLFTMLQGKRPIMSTFARAWRNVNAILYKNGNMEYHGLAVSGTGLTLLATYMLQ